ncbi:MAG: hypothetical protein A2X47_02360 [Lentisphaerae bacterium GWF2_38_69]|nr:MAG: hypothetical protein A2X47_02360 [Lentisphaerae bacterium GWF2_38_69]
MKELRANIQNLENNSETIYQKQSAEREAFLNAPENQECIAKIKASLKAAQIAYEMRKKAGLTQAEIAKILHIRQPNYARIERGQNVSINTLADIANACGAEIDIKYHFKHA